MCLFKLCFFPDIWSSGIAGSYGSSKANIYKWYLIKLKDLHSKGNHKQNKKTITEWEKMFANEVTDKGLISK